MGERCEMRRFPSGTTGVVVIGISDQLKVPVKYIGLGEGMEDMQLFNKKEFVDSLFKKSK